MNTQAIILVALSVMASLLAVWMYSTLGTKDQYLDVNSKEFWGNPSSNTLAPITVTVVTTVTATLVSTHTKTITSGTNSCDEKTKIKLKEAFKQAGTDKFHRHGYFRHYEAPLANIRRTVERPRLLEIGVNDGNSMTAWQMYFETYDLIAGFAGGPAGTWAQDPLVTKIADKKYAFASKDGTKEPVIIYSDADQTDEDYLDWFIKDSGGKFNVIVDDASHVPWHQLFTFAVLFPHVVEGGVYIFEDLETSYWDKAGSSIYGYPIDKAGVGKPSPGNAIEALKLWVDVVNRAYLNDMELSFFNKIDHLIGSITFASNCAIVTRVETKEFQPYLQNLAFHYLASGADSSLSVWKKNNPSIELPKMPKSFNKTA
jgi:hypothetical protein